MAPTVYTPPVNTYIPIGSVTLSATATEVTFSSIPATYRDLVLVMTGKVTSAPNNTALRFNADSTSSYTAVYALGYSGGAISGTFSDTFVRSGGWNTSSEQSIIWQIMDYSASDKHTSVLSRNNSDGGATVGMWAGRWAKTEAITSVTVLNVGSVPYAIGSTFSLYAIAG